MLINQEIVHRHEKENVGISTMNHQVSKKQDADRDLWSNCFIKQ